MRETGNHCTAGQLDLTNIPKYGIVLYGHVFKTTLFLLVAVIKNKEKAFAKVFV